MVVAPPPTANWQPWGSVFAAESPVKRQREDEDEPPRHEAVQRQAPAAPLSAATGRKVRARLDTPAGPVGSAPLPVVVARPQEETDVGLAGRADRISEKVARLSFVRVVEATIPARCASDGEIAAWVRSLEDGYGVDLVSLAAQLLAPALAQGQKPEADLDMLYELITRRSSTYPRPEGRSTDDDEFNTMVRELKTTKTETAYSKGCDDVKLFKFAALSKDRAANQAAQVVKARGASEHLAKEVALAAGALVSEILDERLKVLGAEFTAAPSDDAMKKIRDEILDAHDCIVFNYEANRELNEAVYLLGRLYAKYHCKGVDVVLAIIKETRARVVHPVGEWLLPVKSCVYYRDADVYGTEYVKRVVKEMDLE